MTTMRWRAGAVLCFGFLGSVWISSCSATSSDPSQQVEAVGTVTSALVDGCTALQRSQCAAVTCGCLDGNCSGGACPTHFDGCSDQQRSQCAAFGTGCLNGNCSGGALPPLFDGCTPQRRNQCGAFGCGCLNGNCSGNACPALVDGCSVDNRSSCAGGGCGCMDNSCSGNACASQSGGCTDPNRSNCAVFTCGCSNDACLAGPCMNGNDSALLPIPPVLVPTSTDATTDYYSITVKPGTAQIRAGARTPIIGFDGFYPGPTIIATKGRQVKVTQTNGLNELISIHNHGHKVAASSDGHPFQTIPAGGSQTYVYPNDQRAGTYWYHDHAMNLTGSHVYRGLAGFYVIHDPAEDSLNLPSGKYDVPLLVQDRKLDANNILVYDPAQPQTPAQVQSGMIGDLGLVNGVAPSGGLTPHFDVDTHRYRFRLLNGSNARVFDLKLKSGKAFQVIGSDGGLLAAPVNNLTHLRVAPAERYDIVIDFGTNALGSAEVLTNTDTTIPVISDLLEFRVKKAVSNSPSVPTTLSTVTRLQASQATGAPLELDFRFNGTDWTINGLTYDHARTDVTSHLGAFTIWTLVNQSGVVHPFHKHLSQFQILDVNGAAVAPEQSGWKDTVAVAPGSTVRIIFKDEGFTTGANEFYVLHCHNLEHEDHAMMLQEKVVSP